MPDSPLTILAKKAIYLLETQLAAYKLTPMLHIELEGCYKLNKSKVAHLDIDYPAINRLLKKQNILGIVKPEFWQNQWEYASLFADQTPLQVVNDLVKALQIIPQQLKSQGAEAVYIQPVVWSGDNRGYCDNEHQLFSDTFKNIHIPNAIQINISVRNKNNVNILCCNHYGEQLQRLLLKTSFACALLFLPEQASYERLVIRNKFKLSAELKSPNQLSGGHQGGIAFYKTHNKHNKLINGNTLVDTNNQPLSYNAQYWQQAARIEHRLASSSMLYNPYINAAFILANVVAISQDYLDSNEHYQEDITTEICADTEKTKQLPHSLYTDKKSKGAIDIFRESNWLSQQLNRSANWLYKKDPNKLKNTPLNIGTQLKEYILAQYPVINTRKQP